MPAPSMACQISHVLSAAWPGIVLARIYVKSARGPQWQKGEQTYVAAGPGGHPLEDTVEAILDTTLLTLDLGADAQDLGYVVPAAKVNAETVGRGARANVATGLATGRDKCHLAVARAAGLPIILVVDIGVPEGGHNVNAMLVA